MSSSAAAEMQRLEAVDRKIGGLPQGARSLCPTRDRATPLGVLAADVADPKSLPVLAEALAAIGEATLKGFPGNLFWDFDYFVRAVDQAARSSSNYKGYIDELTKLVVSLMSLYGARSAIRFQYVHDFTYGFDWARWMSRSSRDSNVLPFDLAFLRMSQDRANELLEMIAKDDSRYAQLPPNAWRNPFPFSRAPKHEARLFRDLAAQGMIPIEAWNASAEPDCTRRYDKLRKARAQALGLPPHAAQHHEDAP